MAEYNIDIEFDDTEEGTIIAKNGTAAVSFTGKAMGPYDLYLGGYGSCLHSTFKGIADKKRLKFTDVKYHIRGVKREEVPTILKFVETTITFTGVAEKDQKGIEKSMKLAERYCSISSVLATVTEMKYIINYK
ncbi:MAG: OsmC family protein [Candidatus Izemoplasma sp.]